MYVCIHIYIYIYIYTHIYVNIYTYLNISCYAMLHYNMSSYVLYFGAHAHDLIKADRNRR